MGGLFLGKMANFFIIFGILASLVLFAFLGIRLINKTGKEIGCEENKEVHPVWG